MRGFLIDSKSQLESKLSAGKLKLDEEYVKAELVAQKARVKRNGALLCLAILFLSALGGSVVLFTISPHPILGVYLVCGVFAFALLISLPFLFYLDRLECKPRENSHYCKAEGMCADAEANLKNYQILLDSPKLLSAAWEPRCQTLSISYEAPNGDVLTLKEYDFSIIQNTRTKEILIDYGSMEVRFPYSSMEGMTT